MEIKLAEALLRRKELQEKVNVLRNFKEKDFFEVKVNRQSVSDGIDNIVAAVPKLNSSQVTAEFDWHARQLRLIDAAIQQANWTTLLEVNPSTMEDFKQPEK